MIYAQICVILLIENLRESPIRVHIVLRDLSLFEMARCSIKSQFYTGSFLFSKIPPTEVNAYQSSLVGSS